MIKTDNHERWRAASHHDLSASALEKFRKPLLHYLDSGLADKDKWVRILAAELLGTLRDPAAGGFLIPLLADADGDVRAGAAAALDAIGQSPVAFTRLQRDGCDTCLIRLIAEEALAAGRGPVQTAEHHGHGRDLFGGTPPAVQYGSREEETGRKSEI